MASVGIVALVVPLLAVILALGWLVLHYSASLARLDLKRLYLYLVSFLGLVLAAGALLRLTQDTVTILLGANPAAGLSPPGLQPGRLDQPWGLPVRDSIAGNLGLFVVAAPVWLRYYQRAVRQSLARQAWTIHRVYLYTVAVLFLVAAIGFAAAMAAQGLRVLLGLVDLSNQLAVRELWQGVARGLLDGGICVTLWWAHYRAIPEAGSSSRIPSI